MKHATLCIIKDGERILFGFKKRGFGAGKFNGFGGKVMVGESVYEAAVRELSEESGIRSRKLEKIGELHFSFLAKEEWNQVVHVFLVQEWDGEAQESEEMKPTWFPISEIPFERMWNDDKYWLPKLLEGKKLMGKFIFKEDNQTVSSYELEEVQFL